VAKNRLIFVIAGAEMALEGFGPPLKARREILCNLEINDRCAWTAQCSSHCYLNSLGSGLRTRSASDDVILDAAREMIWSGAAVRHLAIPGKEPMESFSLLLSILKEYHEAPRDLRPANLGIITAAAKLIERHTGDMADWPLDWLVVSMDTANSGLRSQGNSALLWRSALNLRKAGGARRIGVNTCFSDTNWRAALAIGKDLTRKGADQWTLGPHLMPVNGFMTATPSADTIRRVVDAVAAELGDTETAVAIELEYAQLFNLFSGHPALKRQLWRWRVEMPLGPNACLIARNPRPKFFLRFRHDGQLLSREDFRRVGLRAGSYGRYEHGGIRILLNQFGDAIQAKDENLLVA
jgi:hypothetical protein